MSHFCSIKAIGQADRFTKKAVKMIGEAIVQAVYKNITSGI